MFILQLVDAIEICTWSLRKLCLPIRSFYWEAFGEVAICAKFQVGGTRFMNLECLLLARLLIMVFVAGLI